MASSRVLPWVVCGLLGCTRVEFVEPDDTGDTSTGTTGGGEGTGADTEMPGAGLGCVDTRWIYEVRGLGEIHDFAVDSRGHVRMEHAPEAGIYRVHDIGLTGWPGRELEFETELESLDWAGVDDQNNLYLRFEAKDGSRDGLRKFAVDGALVWEVASDPALNGYPVIAPDGAAVVTRDSSILKYDAGGKLVWELPNPEYLRVRAINAAGVAVAVVGVSKQVRALGPDGATLWESTWGVEALTDHYYGIAGSGEVVVGEMYNGIARFAADGGLLWERSEDQLGISSITAMTMNAAGQVAVVGTRPKAATAVFTVDAAGEIGAPRGCPGLTIEAVALDEAGEIYVAGYDYNSDNGQQDWFVVAFD